ncbi:hypothetical protein QE401_003470 [Pseudoroseomonas cervicalis]|nr:hypothetical protein [Pseudoroseomonas cervicalis]
MQAVKWPGPTARSGGTASAHASRAKRQRVRKAQPEGRVQRRGDVPLQDHPPRSAPQRRVRHGRGGEQRLGIGMARIAEQRAGLGDLHHPAEIHHRDAVGDMPHHRQIMRDEQDGQAEFFFQFQKEIHHLRLDRHVQRRDRLIRHQEAGLHDQRPRDADALALPARQLMRVPLRMMRLQPDQAQHLRHALPPLRPADAALDDQRRRHDALHAHARIQRGEGVLEHQLHPPPQRPQRAPRQMRDVLALEADGAAAGLGQPQQRAAERRLAGAGFAHHGEDLAGGHREGDTVQRLHQLLATAEQAATHREMLLQVADFEKRGHTRGSAGRGDRVPPDPAISSVATCCQRRQRI